MRKLVLHLHSRTSFNSLSRKDKGNTKPLLPPRIVVSPVPVDIFIAAVLDASKKIQIVTRLKDSRANTARNFASNPFWVSVAGAIADGDMAGVNDFCRARGFSPH